MGLVLTENVLKRPWVAAEIVTAHTCGAVVILVEIQRPGLAPFKYPDEMFFEDLRANKILDSNAVQLLQELDITMQDVERSYRSVFQKVAVPFSPHKSWNI